MKKRKREEGKGTRNKKRVLVKRLGGRWGEGVIVIQLNNKGKERVEKEGEKKKG